jgi:hypothetical protein
MNNETDSDAEQRWWEKTWRERERGFFEAFGKPHPPGGSEGTVISLGWDDMILPGGCVYVFPPDPDGEYQNRESRPHWLYLTHGPTQPLGREEWQQARAGGNRESAFGVEYAILGDEPISWAPEVLRQTLRTSLVDRRIDQGDIGPVGFLESEASDAAEKMLWLVFWRYLSPFGTFTTSTGSVKLLVATSISDSERQLAEDVSVAHLLLLLHHAGVGQRSIPDRPDVLETPKGRRHWPRVKELRKEDVEAELAAIAKRKRP